MLADLEQQSVSAREQWRVESATLTRVLRLDPRAVVEPLEHDHTQITLIDPGRTLDDLMPIAIANRPEIRSRRSLLAAAEIRIRRERARPFIPEVVLNGFQTPYEMLQAGIFGIGPNSSLNQWSGRDDVSIQPLFQLQNIGLGNLAKIKLQRGMESLATIDLFDSQDAAAQEVNQAQCAFSQQRRAWCRLIERFALASSRSMAPSRACRRPAVSAMSSCSLPGLRKPFMRSNY